MQFNFNGFNKNIAWIEVIFIHNPIISGAKNKMFIFKIWLKILCIQWLWSHRHHQALGILFLDSLPGLDGSGFQLQFLGLYVQYKVVCMAIATADSPCHNQDGQSPMTKWRQQVACMLCDSREILQKFVCIKYNLNSLCIHSNKHAGCWNGKPYQITVSWGLDSSSTWRATALQPPCSCDYLRSCDIECAAETTPIQVVMDAF